MRRLVPLVVLLGLSGLLFWQCRQNTPNNLTIASPGTNGAPFFGDPNFPPAGVALNGNGGTAVVKYTFSPTAAGVANGRASIILQGGAAQVVRPDLTGTGIYSANSGRFAISLPGTPAPQFIDFGQVRIGTAPSPTQTANVANSAAQPITANSSSNDPVFAVTPPNPNPIPAAGQSTVTVTFTPTQPGTYTYSCGMGMYSFLINYN